jgi:hypothetical protein
MRKRRDVGHARLFSPLVGAELEEIGDYIARDNPTRAIAFIHFLETDPVLGSRTGSAIQSLIYSVVYEYSGPS